MTINTDIQTLKKWYERGTLTEKEFSDAAIKYINEGASETEKHLRATEIDAFLDKFAK